MPQELWSRGYHWRRVGSRIAAGNAPKWADLGRFLLLPFPPVVTCKEISNHKSQLILVVFLCFQICFSPLFFQICRIWSWALHAPPTGQVCGWQDRQLPSSSFISTPAVSSTAAMVGRSAHLSSLALLPFGLPPYFFVFSAMRCC